MNWNIKFIDEDGNVRDIFQQIEVDSRGDWATRITAKPKEVRKLVVNQEKLGHAFPRQIIRYMMP